MTAALELEGVEKSFPGVCALKAVSLRVEPGEFVGLVGGNGAGKSTLMKILSGVDQPDSGTILHDGKEVVLRGPKEAHRVGIGMVHQGVAKMPAAQATTHRLHELMVGRTQRAEYHRESAQEPPRDEVVRDVRGLGLGRSYRCVSFSLHEDEVLGIAGVLGSGPEALSRTLAGLAPADSGEIRMHGRPIRLDRPRAAVAAGIGYVPRERRVEGIVGFLPMASNITLGHLASVMRGVFLDHAKEREAARAWVKKLSIRPPRLEQLAMNLSGGNQQKIVLATWIQAGARILILDHPTRGLDVGAKEEVDALVRGLSAAGVAVLLTADTLEETIGLSHRVLVMKDGRVTAEILAPRGAKPDQVRLIEDMV